LDTISLRQIEEENLQVNRAKIILATFFRNVHEFLLYILCAVMERVWENLKKPFQDSLTEECRINVTIQNWLPFFDFPGVAEWQGSLQCKPGNSYYTSCLARVITL
jgi:hypothetical protein